MKLNSIPAGDAIIQFTTVLTRPKNPLNIITHDKSSFAEVRIGSLTSALLSG
ncbi:hypothetical protein XBKB1_3380005 [Xenorhabdus bovienii str. kraussei Becker Underwood]|uniref:Uncharacterized protein n=1 Tax=Xenorhabdus bovienii str. kraussei Becker Underwood TaxID=1398204 RepID=A0A077PYS9_XENBV|nr:hypothetical protein XBKB1_3380005 [Xenorhabdus bovienii str. kraussei Becker Underwood]